MCAFSKIFSQQTIPTETKYTKIAKGITYLIKAKIASRGCHVYKNTT